MPEGRNESNFDQIGDVVWEATGYIFKEMMNKREMLVYDLKKRTYLAL